MVKSKLEQQVIDALEQVSESHGVDIVDVEVVGATKAPCVRVRIDRLDGEAITLDEVTANNAWVSDVVEGLDPFAGSYTLEVSSPGLARPLRRPSDFARFVGEPVELTTTATEGQRRHKGTLAAADEHAVTIEAEGAAPATISYGDIKKCTLKPVIDFKGGKGDK